MFLKKKKKKDEYIEPGTFKYLLKTRKMNPFEIYHERLEYLKQKKKEKQDGKSEPVSQSRE